MNQERKESIFGTSTDFDNVHKEQTFDGANPDLIIHDSGGFENGSTKATDALQSFLKERDPETADITQRVHCIWYVIACNGSKPIHPIDELFLQNQFKVAQIPVFIVITKYDKIIDAFREDEPKASDKVIEEKAFKEFKRGTLDPLRALVKEAQTQHGMNVEICTVGLRKREREFQPVHVKPAGMKHWGSTQLVSLMRANLSEELRPLLAAVQVADPRNKLEGKLHPLDLRRPRRSNPSRRARIRQLTASNPLPQKPSRHAPSSTGAPSWSNRSRSCPSSPSAASPRSTCSP